MPKHTARGAQFKADVLATYDLRPDEIAVLDEVAATLDILADPGLPVSEQRMQRLVLARLMGLLGLTDPTSPDPTNEKDGKSIRGRAAARARWDRVNNERSA